MATFGEIAWTGLISRQNTFRSLFDATEFVYIEFISGMQRALTAESEWTSFILTDQHVVFPGRALDVPNVFLCLKAYDFEGNSVTKKYRMKWPSYLRDGVTRVYRAAAKRKFILFPVEYQVPQKRGREIQPSVKTSVDKTWVPVTISRTNQLSSSTLIVARRAMESVTRRLPTAIKRDPPTSRLTNGTLTQQYYTTSSRTNPSATTTGLVTLEVRHRNASRAVTPNFRSITRRELKTLPYSLDLRKTQPGYGYQKITALRDGTELFDAGPMLGGFVSVPAPALALDAECNSKALRRLLDATGIENSNIACSLVQWKQLDSMIGSNAVRLVQAVNSLRKGNISKAVDVLWPGATSSKGKMASPKFRKNGGPKPSRSLASNWLELQYGWKPLLMDIKGALEAHSRLMAKDRTIIAVTGSATVRRISVSQVMAPLAGSYATVVPFPCGSLEIVTEHRCKYGMAYALDDAEKAFQAQTGFANPVNLAWELVPFSFVADWFLPIGPYLEQMQTLKGQKFVEGYKSYSVRESTVCSVRDSRTAGTGDQQIAIGVTGGGSRERLMFRREKLTAFPSAEPPQFKNPISMAHSLNALALIRVAFRT